LPRRLASCGFPGFTPGARPVVELSVADGDDRPGVGPPELFGPAVGTPGVAELPVPLRAEPEDAPAAEPDDAPPPPELPPPPL
jgi:hypothetical protein